mgnify:CR=1 FL=1
MTLETILHPQPLTTSPHDRLIMKVSADTQLSPNVMTLFTNAKYKQPHFEGDIDLLQIMINSHFYGETPYKEIPVDETRLLMYEMKTTDNTKNRDKAMEQLYKSKNFLRRYSDYHDIDCFYASWCGKSYVMKWVDM